MGKEIESILKKAVKKSDSEMNDNLKVKSVELVGKKTPEERTGYDKINSSNFYIIKENILDWSNKDFALYISKKFTEKYSEYWDVRIMGVTTYIGRIKESLFNLIGFCDNVTLKNYIDFFFYNYIDQVKTEAGGKFFVSSLKKSYIIESFLENYKYSPSLPTKPIIIDKEGIKENDLEKSYIIGNESMVLKYGIVLPINYLIIKKAYIKEKAIDVINSAVRNIKNVSGLEVIINRTVDFSPYPKEFPFHDFNKVVFILGKSDLIKKSIFKKTKLYEFLRS